MPSILLNLSYLFLVSGLIALLIAGFVWLLLTCLNIYQASATYAKAYNDYTKWQKRWQEGRLTTALTEFAVCFFHIAVVAVMFSFASAILRLLIGGGINVV